MKKIGIEKYLYKKQVEILKIDPYKRSRNPTHKSNPDLKKTDEKKSN